MQDFKRIVKMKTGGSVSKAIGAYEKRERKSEEKADIKQDKAIVKKGVRQHEAALHKGEPKTELKLKTGGRAKKSKGTVRKFENASGQYGAKKTAEDKKNIAEAKKFKKGGKVKKYNGEDGSFVTKGIEAVKSFGRDIKNNILGTPEQNKKAQENLDKQAAEGSKLAKFFGGNAEAPSAPVKKCSGGKMRKKYATGGSIDDDVRARAMKWIESGSPEQPTGEVVKTKTVVKKEKPLPMPDYSNEDLDRMDAEIAENERKRESASLAARYPKKSTAGQTARALTKTEPSSMEEKGARLMRNNSFNFGFKRGGKACKK